MRKETKDGVTYFSFDLLNDCPKVRHGVFSRQGGTSEAPYDSLNLGHRVKDSDSAFKKNLSIACETLQISQVQYANQVHGKRVCQIQQLSPPPEADALVTAKPGLGLMIQHADCQAALFYDPCQHVAAAVHAGWRGLVQNIYRETIQFMCQSYGCRPENLLTCIGPSLGPQAAEFIYYKEEFPPSFWTHQIEKNQHFDLWAIAEQQLQEGGILPHHIEVAGLCTYEHAEHFFSYRRERPLTGRNGTFIALT